MKSVIVNRIIGTLIYSGYGLGEIDKNNVLTRSEEITLDLDNEEFNVDVLYTLPNGDLCIFSTIGDEQPSSVFQIITNWRVEHIKREVEPVAFKEFNKFFREVRMQYGSSMSGVPSELKEKYFPIEKLQKV